MCHKDKYIPVVIYKYDVGLEFDNVVAKVGHVLGTTILLTLPRVCRPYLKVFRATSYICRE